jgi:5'-nucleotidase
MIPAPRFVADVLFPIMQSPLANTLTPSLNWSAIDTVLLDMDGTLLDLSFDNFFWLEWLPRKYGEARALTLAAAQAELEPRFAAMRGRLEWYCTDYWSRELNLDVAALKHQVRDRIGWLPGAREFLLALRRFAKRLILVTNAHRDSLRIKGERTGLAQYFDALVSSHDYGHAKEHSGFWPALLAAHPFDSSRTLFVDDSLPVLRAARAHGIAHLVAITHPDSNQPERACDEFASAPRIGLLTPSL